MKTTINYYESQLNKLDTQQFITIKLSDGVNSTNYLDLNIESIEAIRDYLLYLEQGYKNTRGNNE